MVSLQVSLDWGLVARAGVQDGVHVLGGLRFVIYEGGVGCE